MFQALSISLPTQAFWVPLTWLCQEHLVSTGPTSGLVLIQAWAGLKRAHSHILCTFGVSGGAAARVQTADPGADCFLAQMCEEPSRHSGFSFCSFSAHSERNVETLNNNLMMIREIQERQVKYNVSLQSVELNLKSYTANSRQLPFFLLLSDLRRKGELFKVSRIST